MADEVFFAAAFLVGFLAADFLVAFFADFFAAGRVAAFFFVTFFFAADCFGVFFDAVATEAARLEATTVRAEDRAADFFRVRACLATDFCLERVERVLKAATPSGGRTGPPVRGSLTPCGRSR